MQAVAYEGYFKNGRFYAKDKVVHVPDKKRIVITIFDDTQIPTFKEARKKETLLRLYGSCPDIAITEPPEMPMELELPRRYDLI